MKKVIRSAWSLWKRMYKPVVLVWAIMMIGGGYKVIPLMLDPKTAKLEALGWLALGGFLMLIPLVAFLFSQAVDRTVRIAEIQKTRSENAIARARPSSADQPVHRISNLL